MSPPEPAAYRELDAPLRAVIERSFSDRVADLPGADLNLANAFWGHTPASPWDALAHFGPTGINVIVRVYERMRALDPALWQHVRYLRNAWYTGSAGFKVVWDDPERARDALDGLFPRVARDTFLGGLEHQARPARALLAERPIDRWLDPREDLPDATTFREVTPLGAEALHFCVGRHSPRVAALDDIHIDWASPVRGLHRSARRCDYDFPRGALHWAQAKFAVGAPACAFAVMDTLVTKAGSDVATRWRTLRWELALRGAEGLARASVYRWEVEAEEQLAAPGDQ